MINSHRGLFKFKRLPYGNSSAPGIFQRDMDNLLQGFSFVAVYLNDILVTGAMEEEHLSTIEKVLGQLEMLGLHVNKKKCQFMIPSITYLGHQIDASELHPLSDKMRAIEKNPAPNNVTEVKLYLGLLTYPGKIFTQSSHTHCRMNMFGIGDTVTNAYQPKYGINFGQ